MLVSEMTFLRDHWHAVAVADEVTPETGPKPVRLLGHDYVLWATAPGRYALGEPFCPHRSAHLGGGWVNDGRLVCPYHGWQFEGSGKCAHIPQMDAGLPTPPRADLRTFPAQARYGVVWACVGEHPVSDRPPVWAEAETEPTWRFHVEFFEEWAAPAPRIVDNLLDHGHVAYVHQDTFGTPADANLPPVDIEFTEGGLFKNQLVSAYKGVSRQNGQTDDESVRVQRRSEVELLAPLTARTRLHYFDAAPDYCFLGGATPIDDTHSIFMRLTGLAGSEAQQPFANFKAFGTRVKEEDRRVLETTQPDFPLDITTEVHLRVDRPTLEYRKYLVGQLAPAPVELRRTA